MDFYDFLNRPTHAVWKKLYGFSILMLYYSYVTLVFSN